MSGVLAIAIFPPDGPNSHLDQPEPTSGSEQVQVATVLPSAAEPASDKNADAPSEVIVPPKLPRHLSAWDKLSVQEARSYLLDCDFFSGDDHQYCLYHIVDFVNTYISGRNGNPTDQDNVATMLTRGGPLFGVQQNRLQGCAWRLVIMGAARADLDSLAMEKMNNSCGPLPTSDRIAAAHRATAIIAQIAPHSR